MIKDNIEFFNVEEIKSDGTILRFKEDLILSLGCNEHKRGRFYGYRSIGAELRFKTNAKFFDITFSAVKEDTSIYLFYGDYMSKKFLINANITQTLHIEVESNILKYQDRLPKNGFSPNLIRFVIGYSGYIKYLGINTFGEVIMAPSECDIPSKTLLIYGSSISHGSEALEYVDSYAFILSRILNINVLNKSIPGSCQAEKQMIDYLNTIKRDTTFIEFGVNVIGLFSLEEYKKRLEYIISKMNNNLYLTSILDNHYLIDNNEEMLDKMLTFRDIAIKCCKTINYIDPTKLLSLTSLTCDLLHPSNFGQLEIALRLKDIINI